MEIVRISRKKIHHICKGSYGKKIRVEVVEKVFAHINMQDWIIFSFAHILCVIKRYSYSAYSLTYCTHQYITTKEQTQITTTTETTPESKIINDQKLASHPQTINSHHLDIDHHNTTRTPHLRLWYFNNQKNLLNHLTFKLCNQKTQKHNDTQRRLGPWSSGYGLVLMRTWLL